MDIFTCVECIRVRLLHARRLNDFRLISTTMYKITHSSKQHGYQYLIYIFPNVCISPDNTQTNKSVFLQRNKHRSAKLRCICV